MYGIYKKPTSAIVEDCIRLFLYNFHSLWNETHTCIHYGLRMLSPKKLNIHRSQDYLLSMMGSAVQLGYQSSKRCDTFTWVSAWKSKHKNKMQKQTPHKQRMYWRVHSEVHTICTLESHHVHLYHCLQHRPLLQNYHTSEKTRRLQSHCRIGKRAWWSGKTELWIKVEQHPIHVRKHNPANK